MDFDDLFDSDRRSHGKGHHRSSHHGKHGHRDRDRDHHDDRRRHDDHDDEWPASDHDDRGHRGRGLIFDEDSGDRHSRPSFPGMHLATVMPRVRKLMHNKVLAVGCLLVALVLAALLTWLVVALVGAISEHGLKGAVDLIQRALKWVWEGAPKGSGE